MRAGAAARAPALRAPRPGQAAPRAALAPAARRRAPLAAPPAAASPPATISPRPASFLARRSATRTTSSCSARRPRRASGPPTQAWQAARAACWSSRSCSCATADLRPEGSCAEPSRSRKAGRVMSTNRRAPRPRAPAAVAGRRGSACAAAGGRAPAPHGGRRAWCHAPRVFRCTYLHTLHSASWRTESMRGMAPRQANALRPPSHCATCTYRCLSAVGPGRICRE